MSNIFFHAYKLLLTGGQRAVVYAAGFCLVYVLTFSLSQEDFGRYSLLQSLIELAALVGTAGLGLVISNETIRYGGADTLKYASRVLPFFLASASCLVAYLSIVANDIDRWATTLGLVTLAGCVTWIVLIYTVRGLGYTTAFVLEPALRAFGISGCLFGAYLWGVSIGLAQLMALVAAAYFTSSAILGILVLRSSRRPHPSPTFATAVKTTIAGLLGFLSRKSDLLILAPLLTPSAIGDYKLAFVIAEIPYQIVLTFLVHNQVNYSSLQTLKKERYSDYVRTLSVAVSLSIAVALFAPTLNTLIFPDFSFMHLMPFISSYFLIRALQYYYDYMFTSEKQFVALLLANSFSFLCKLIVIPCSFLLLGDSWYICLPFLAALEFTAWELSALAALGRSPGLEFFRFLSGRAGR